MSHPLRRFARTTITVYVIEVSIKVSGHCCPIKPILLVEGWSVGAIFRRISLILDIARWAGSYDSR